MTPSGYYQSRQSRAEAPQYDSDPAIVPVAAIVQVARYSACETAGHKWKRLVVAVCGVARVTAIVPLYPAGTYRRYRRGTTSNTITLCCIQSVLMFPTLLRRTPMIPCSAV